MTTPPWRGACHNHVNATPHHGKAVACWTTPRTNTTSMHRSARKPLTEDAMSAATLPAPETAEAAPAVDLNDKAHYIHRELSQLQFNNRVLEQALDERT